LASHPSPEAVLVIGLGRFGGAVAETLASLGHEVLGIDEDAGIVQAWADRLTHVVQADTTDQETLERLGVADFQHAIVAIGTDMEASVLTVLALSELGVPRIWAKALSAKHGRILERTGAHRVIYPEADMGRRVARLVAGRMMDVMEIEDGVALCRTRIPPDCAGRSLADCRPGRRQGVAVIGVKRAGQAVMPALPDTILEAGDTLILAGTTTELEAFAATV